MTGLDKIDLTGLDKIDSQPENSDQSKKIGLEKIPPPQPKNYDQSNQIGLDKLGPNSDHKGRHASLTHHDSVYELLDLFRHLTAQLVPVLLNGGEELLHLRRLLYIGHGHRPP